MKRPAKNRKHIFRTNSPISKLSLAVFVLGFAAIGYILLKSNAASYMTGASLGICSPSPCTAGTIPSWPSTNVVNMGTINNGQDNETRYWAYYIPQNLVTNDPGHPPAAVFFTGGGGGEFASSNIVPNGFNNTKLQAEADAHNFIVIILMPPPQALSGNPSGRSGWLHPQTDCGGGGGVPGGGTCGASSSPSDEPYIKAAVNAATARFNIDPARRYVVGGSSGANMSRDIACDASQAPSNSTLFRGFATLGGGANAKYKTRGPGACPSGNRDIFYLQIMGKSTQQDPYTTIDLTSGDHTILGFDDTRTWWAGYLGNCGTPVHRLVGTPSALNDVYDYTCANAVSPQFEAVAITNGGHTWCNLDEIQGLNCTAPSPPASSSRNGWSTAAWMWNFFANTTTSTTGTGDTTPPSAPAGLTKTASTPSSISLSWTASTDNVGVAGYDIYKNGTQIGSTASTSYTIASLTCGTSYNLAVDAFDSAGNRSAQTSTSLSTSACPPASIPGDINGDGKVDLSDLAILLTHYGRTATASQGDLNGDGKVSLADLAILLSNFGR